MRISILLVAAAAVSAPALAQTAAEPSINRSELVGDIEANFKSLDTDSNGIVTKPEIAAGQKRMVSETSAAVERKFAAEFRKLDTNKDGMLNLTEFTAAAPDAKARASVDARLEKYDSNNDGKITLEEVRAPVLANFDRLDVNKDGVLTFSEQSNPPPQRR